MLPRFFATFHSDLNDKKRKRKKAPTSNERSNVAKKRIGPASLFCREAEVLFGTLKTKSCLSDSEFFLFSGEKCRSRQKSADGEFLCFVSLFVQRNEESSRLERKGKIEQKLITQQ